MPRRSPRPPAPRGFWDEVRTHQERLWADTEEQHVRKFWGVSTKDGWEHLNDAFEPTGATWRSHRYLRGLVDFSTLDIVQNPLGMPASDELPPAVGTYYTYSFGRNRGDQEPALTVRHELLSADDDTSHLLSMPTQINELRSGLWVPEAPDYQAFLAELALGASGEYRAAWPPD